MIDVLIKDSEASSIYSFSIVDNGIDFRIDGFLVDIIEDFGIIDSVDKLRTIVSNLMKSWKLDFIFLN